MVQTSLELYDPRNGDVAVGSFLVFVMSFVTLSFLITTPECWVPALGSSEHGFPLLSGAGRLVVKDAIMMGAALVTMADSANIYATGRPQSHQQRRAGDLEQRKCLPGKKRAGLPEIRQANRLTRYFTITYDTLSIRAVRIEPAWLQQIRRFLD
jgi:hypothetical protein